VLGRGLGLGATRATLLQFNFQEPQVSVFERIERKIDNMSTMLTRFGIDRAEFAQRRPACLFRNSVRACQSCPNGDICSGWLQQAGSRIDRIPEFCPNGRRFERAKTLGFDAGQ
jgi:Family of unknown function (DUF6455)